MQRAQTSARSSHRPGAPPPRARRSLSRSRDGREGFTLLELLVAMPLVLLAAAIFLSTLAASSRQRTINREKAQVSLRVQEVFEQMRNAEFRELFALYNAYPFDDPGGPGTAPGAFFDVEGIQPPEATPGIRVGEIRLPFFNAGDAVDQKWEVRENLTDEELGLPRDLNGDSVRDALDHSLDYTLLPVEVVVRWQGMFGEREYRMHTLLADWRSGR